MKISMAIIGYGGMGAYHHEMLTKRNGPITVAGAYDIRPEAVAKIKENGIKAYASSEELLQDPNINLVLVSTPNDTHKSYAVACLEAGKHVICEKPATLNAQELEEIIAASERSGRFFTVHQNRRFDSDFLTVKRIVEENKLGHAFMFESRVQGSRQYLHGWRGYKVNGGGMVYDWGAHLIDQMLQIIPDKVVSVAAQLHGVSTDEVDDNFTAMFRFENGTGFLVNVAMHCFAPQPRWHVCCENGTAVVEDWALNGRLVRLKDDCETPEWDEIIVYTAAGPTRSMAPRHPTTQEELPLPVVKGEWIKYYDNIAECCEGKAVPLVKPQESLRVARLIDKVFEASNSGASIACSI